MVGLPDGQQEVGPNGIRGSLPRLGTISRLNRLYGTAGTAGPPPLPYKGNYGFILD